MKVSLVPTGSHSWDVLTEKIGRKVGSVSAGRGAYPAYWLMIGNQSYYRASLPGIQIKAQNLFCMEVE